jgi:hypothetical protein
LLFDLFAYFSRRFTLVFIIIFHGVILFSQE